MCETRLIQVIGALLFLVAFASNVNGLCWSCMPNNLSEDNVVKILAEEFKNNFLKTLGRTSEPVVPNNITYPPQEIIDDLFPHEKEDNQALETILLQPLNSHSRKSNKTSFFEYKTTDKLDSYRIEQVTLWLPVNDKTDVYEVYEKVSTQPRRMVFMDRHSNDASKWKKLIFTPNKLWLQNPWRKIRIEINGVETFADDKPVLQLNLKLKEKRLKKRHVEPTNSLPTNDCHPINRDLCCKRERIVPIREIYKWILVPATYRAFTCSGKCPLKHRNNNTWSFINQIVPPTLAPGPREPCCVPTAFEAVTILYVDGTNQSGQSIVKRMNMENASVKSCGCT